MRNLIFATASLLILSPNAAFAQSSQGDHLSVEQVMADVNLAKEAYSRIHPGYTRYSKTVTLDAAWNDVIADAHARSGMSQGEFYLAVQKVLTLIRCDHTKAELPKALRKDRNKTPVYLPLRWHLVEGRALISIPSKNSGLERGDETVSYTHLTLPTIYSV